MKKIGPTVKQTLKMGGAFRTITKIWYSFELFWKAFWRAFSIAYFISFSLIQTSVIRKQRNLQKWIQWSKKRQLKKSSTPQIECHQKQYFYTAIWSWRIWLTNCTNIDIIFAFQPLQPRRPFETRLNHKHNFEYLYRSCVN